MWHLAEPKALFAALIPLAIAGIFLYRKRSPRLRTLLKLASHRDVLGGHARRTRRAFRLLFAGTIVSLLVFAYVAARPMRVRSWARKVTEGIDIVICLDLSESMEATDLVPTRILAAKRVIRDFIAKRSNDRIGFVTFGGEAVTRAPLTRDYEFLLSQVEAVNLRELKQGTAIGNGLANSVGRLRHSESKNKVIILLTDGDSNVGAINPITAAHLARQEGIKIYAIGMGEKDRVVVPIYAYDMFGKKTQLVAQVPSYLNPELLKQLAQLTGGRAYMARDSGALNAILQEIDKLERTKVKLQPMQKREELFFIPALIATLLLAAVYLLEETRFRKAYRKHVAAV